MDANALMELLGKLASGDGADLDAMIEQQRVKAAREQDVLDRLKAIRFSSPHKPDRKRAKRGSVLATVVAALSDGPKTVREICAHTGLPLSTVSTLTVRNEDYFVRDKSEGGPFRYRLKPGQSDGPTEGN